MSPRDIGAITNKMKAEIEGESGKLEGKVDYDIESKSKTTQAIKLFSEGKNLVDVNHTLWHTHHRPSHNIVHLNYDLRFFGIR
jgi:hypothetical protein